MQPPTNVQMIPFTSTLPLCWDSILNQTHMWFVIPEDSCILEDTQGPEHEAHAVHVPLLYSMCPAQRNDTDQEQGWQQV